MLDRSGSWALLALGLFALATGCGSGDEQASGDRIRLDASGCTTGFVIIRRDGANYRYGEFGVGDGLPHEWGLCAGDAFPGCPLPPTLPPALGQAFAFTDPMHEVPVDVTVESVTDAVSVAGGAFTGCARYAAVYTLGATPGATYPTRCTMWLAPGVGVVKVWKEFHDPAYDLGYELTDHATPGAAAADYLPLAVGNHWSLRTDRGPAVATWTVTAGPD